MLKTKKPSAAIYCSGQANGTKINSNGNTTKINIKLDPVDRMQRFAPFAAKIRAEALPETLIQIFHHYYEQLLAGETGYIPSAEAQPVESLPIATELTQYAQHGREVLAHTVMIKLNGGLGTTMGLEGPKSLLQYHQGRPYRSFQGQGLCRLGERVSCLSKVQAICWPCAPISTCWTKITRCGATRRGRLTRRSMRRLSSS